MPEHPETLADLRTVRVGGTELCVRDRGSGPAVVLLHGTTGSLGVWDAVVAHLGGAVRTVAVDQRGHGRSGRPASGYGADEYTADLLGLIAELDCGPAVVCGHSLGARNGVVAAAREPAAVRGVVALDYTPFIERRVLDELEARVRGGDRVFASAEEVAGYIRGRYPLMPEDAVRRRVAYGYTREAGGYRALADPAAMVRTVEGLRRDFAEETRAVAVPVTLVRGALSRLVSPDAFAATRRLRPDLRAVELPGVDHYVPEEAPERVAGLIREMVGAAP
ncbi:alpha/beta fold hydrolase [Allonocardiopsis opalescens]|uniref:2-(Acetamidomethylene)succinate hydrolase n=1 Tax=Allonocardiopsis opalescens TaxID=1144618 RepID=A0A2T0PZC1_9ACTN|nr:alpha/beta hydrolase [Allonocardiopsis opalescens]PRX96757.1 2-(acetamidomethylene)succinate hydrolase [Allonocardiopsis opalescens]